MKTNPRFPILVIDDDQNSLQGFELFLMNQGYNNILLCDDPRNVEEILENETVSILLLDLSMPHIPGEELLARIVEKHPDIPVLIITGNTEIETAVRCIKTGAYDFFLKSAKPDELAPAISRAIDNRNLHLEISNLRKCVLTETLDNPEVFSNIVTNNSTMISIFRYIEAIAPSPEPVLITGECGVGKEMISNALHDLSKRSGDFVSVNIAGLDDTLFSDTLFGHKKGAYTGAENVRKGLIEKAFGGTLFLDEIGDLSPASQVKLLRLIQEKEFYPLGSDTPVKSEVRIIAATNHNLEALLEKNEFRNDLYYRLNTHRIRIPSLKERVDDIPLLISFFIEEAVKSYKKPKPEVDPQVQESLLGYGYPGNIRELRSIIFDAVCLAKNDKITMDLIQTHLKDAIENGNGDASIIEGKSRIQFTGKLPSLKETANLLIEEALKRTNGNQTHAAKILGITHQALNKRLKGKTEDNQ